MAGTIIPVTNDLGGKGVLRFFKDAVRPHQTLLVTDAAAAHWKATRECHHHAGISDPVAYADGSTHTNTIEGLWSLLKRAWHGSHHHAIKHCLSLGQVGNNHRQPEYGFGVFLRDPQGKLLLPGVGG